MEEAQEPDNEFDYLFYEIPRLREERRQKRVYCEPKYLDGQCFILIFIVIKEDQNTYHWSVESTLKSHLISKEVYDMYNKDPSTKRKKNPKNEYNFTISTYNFQEFLLSNEIKKKWYQEYEQLTDTLLSSKATQQEYQKNFAALWKTRHGDHKRIEIAKEDKQEWTEYVKLEILEKIIKKIIQQSKDCDVYLLIMMNPLEIFEMSYLSNEFTKIGARAKVFFLANGEFKKKKHLPFAIEIQKYYSTQHASQPAHFFDKYVFGNVAKDSNSFYEYYSSASQQILTEIEFNGSVETQEKFQVFPWAVPTDVVPQGSIVLSKIDYGESVKLKYNKNELVFKCKRMSVDEMIDIYAGWVNQIVSDCYNLAFEKKDVEVFIKFLYSFMEKHIHQIKEGLFKIDKPIENMTIKQRVLAQTSNRFFYKLSTLFKALSEVFQSDTVGELTDEQEKQRMKIGTEIGKYHQRSLVMKGMSVDDFLEMKEKFIEELKKVRGKINPETDQDRSCFSLETQKDVFLQEDIIEGLNEISSQYHLISAFPLIGLGVSLKRSNGSMINPYLIKVTDFAKINANVDTVSIQNTPDKELNLNAGFYLGADFGGKSYQIANYGFKELKWTQYQPKKSLLRELEETQLFYYKSEQLKERIDAVVPLFGPKDYDLKPLLSTHFFHVLMTFNVVHNVDTCYTEAYFAILANTLILLLNQIPRSTYIQDLLDKIYHSVKIVYSHKKFFKQFCELILTNPRLAMVTYHEGHPTQCQDPSKALLVLFYLVKNGDISDKAQIKDILIAIMQDIVARGIKNLEHLHKYFGIVGYDTKEFQKIEKSILNDVVGDVQRFSSVRLMMEEVEKALKTGKYFEFVSKCKLYINKEEFGFMSYGKFNFFQSMKTICLYFLPEEKFSGALLWVWLLHAQKYPNSYTRNSTEIQKDIFKVYVNIKRQKSIYFIREETRQIAYNCLQILKKRYMDEMAPLHLNTLPETEDSIKAKIEAYHYPDFHTKFNNVSNLSKNTCLSPSCPFYLQRMTSVSEHIKDINCSIPGFHKTVKLMKAKDPEIVYKAIADGWSLNDAKMIDYMKQKTILQSLRIQKHILVNRKEEILNLIVQLQAQYKEIVRKEV